jgi:hypothetical protein
MSPIYSYGCPYGHKHEQIRPYDMRLNASICPDCGAPAQYEISAHHRQPDGIYSYAENIGSADKHERWNETIRRNREEGKR